MRYLHLNPERMRSPLQAATYRWGSHGAYLGKESLVNVETAPGAWRVCENNEQGTTRLFEVYR